MEHYDVIIIGTGAGGGTLAHRLGPSGKKILLLERGGYLAREPENWDSREVFRKERYLDDELWLDKDGTPYKPHQQYFVGGNTKFYGAILFRLRERDFQEVRHYGGISPAWPISVVPRAWCRGRGSDRTASIESVPLSGRLARAAHPAAVG
jgi:choline dehydrogenase-like flavoprotein